MEASPPELWPVEGEGGRERGRGREGERERGRYNYIERELGHIRGQYSYLS